jgi:HEAT repeat protein
MSNLVQAQAAALAQDWSLVSNCLVGVDLRQATPVEQSQFLDLAVQVLIVGDFQDSWQIAKVLPLLGQMAIEPLLTILQDDALEPEVQWFIGRILGEFRSPTVAAGLAQCLLQHPDSELAEITLHALIQIGSMAIAQLTVLLNTNKLAAVTALAQIRHSQTIPPLLTVVNDPDVHIRLLAIEALSSFHDPQVPSLLIGKLTDVDATVRKAAVTGLGLRVDLNTELQLVKHLQPLLLDLNLGVCIATAMALGRLGDQSAAQVLFNCYQELNCPEPLQRQIVRCLGWIDRPFALQYLQIILVSNNLAIIPEVIRALGQSRQSGTIQILTDYLRTLPTHYPAEIKQEIAVSLGNFSQTVAVDEIINLLADPSEQVRWHAIYCLERLDKNLVARRLQDLRLTTASHPRLVAGIEQCLLAWQRK